MINIIMADKNEGYLFFKKEQYYFDILELQNNLLLFCMSRLPTINHVKFFHVQEKCGYVYFSTKVSYTAIQKHMNTTIA